MGFFSVKGARCIDPPIPESKHKLQLMWNKKYPPRHNETVMYVCNAGDSWNRLNSDFEKNNFTLKCLPDNKFEEAEWPTCMDSEYL